MCRYFMGGYYNCSTLNSAGRSTSHPNLVLSAAGRFYRAIPFGLLVRAGGGALESGRDWQSVVSRHPNFFCQLFNLVLVIEKLSGLTLRGIFFFNPIIWRAVWGVAAR